MNKTQARQLQRDYIPSGKPVDITSLIFRRTREDEIYQCGAQSTYDPQSGPIFCGRVAEFIFVDAEGVVALCGNGRHRPRHIAP